MEFLSSRKPDLETRGAFVHQLMNYENRMIIQGFGPKTSMWNEVFSKDNKFENEELLLRNTFLNAQMGPLANFWRSGNDTRHPYVKWTDTI